MIMEALNAQFTPDWEHKALQLRQEFHAHPEASGDEVWTINRIMEELRDMGIEAEAVQQPTPDGGVVRGIIANLGATNPTSIVGLAADCDALECDDVLGHWCGHDIHTTALLGAARALKGIENHLKATGRQVRLFFHGGEETACAPYLVQHPRMRTSRCNRLYALHCYPQIAAGTIGLLAGPVNASADFFYLTFKGRSGHTSRPEEAVDAGAMAADAYRLLGKQVHATFPGKRLVVKPGKVIAGEKANGVPGKGFVAGTARTYDQDVYEQLEDVVTEVATNIAESHGGKVEVRYDRKIGPVNNAPALHPRAKKAVEAAGAKEVEGFQSMGGDDFAAFEELSAEGIYYAELGVGRPGTPNGDIHSTEFDPDVELALPTAARYLAAVAVLG